MTKRQDLYLQRRSRPEQSDQRQPNQAKSISHEPRASPDSAALTSRIEFPTMTGGESRPDLGRGLLNDAARLVPQRDRMPGGRQQVSVLVEDSSARARCPDIDADEGLLHLNPASDQRQFTSTYNLRQRGQHFRSSGWRRRTPGTGRRMQSRRPLPSAPSAYRRSRHHTSAGCF